jgi:hypothetical protein
MTPEDAKKKWCPFARAYDRSETGDVTATNRPLLYGDSFTGPRKDINCIAGECMAWRRLNMKETSGYCGLSGKPEFKP